MRDREYVSDGARCAARNSRCAGVNKTVRLGWYEWLEIRASTNRVFARRLVEARRARPTMAPKPREY